MFHGLQWVIVQAFTGAGRDTHWSLAGAEGAWGVVSERSRGRVPRHIFPQCRNRRFSGAVLEVGPHGNFGRPDESPIPISTAACAGAPGHA